ncbi:prolyl oligopeptidase family serine peptidase [Roseateles sp. DC23W]|uniref:Prolyl oligopeptidase family serine peptidase n=1 Tax=Pelomonas dachongensis TaxID=3299029 RepID=A0ABW7EV78_9BURK
MRIYLLASLIAMLAAALSPDTVHGSVGPSVRDVVEFKKITQPAVHDAEAMSKQTSADGTRAFIVTRRSDVATDINRYEILMLDLDSRRLAQGRPAPPEVVFKLDAAVDGIGGYPALAQVQWAGDQTLVFRAKVRDEVFQVYSLDLKTRQVVQLSHASMPIVSFAMSRDLKRLVYAARVPNPPMRSGEHSIVVGNQWIRAALYGQQSPAHQVPKYSFYVEDVGSNSQPRPLGEPFLQSNGGLPVVDISPDGRWAILPKFEVERVRDWRTQYPLLRQAAQVYGPSLTRDPLRYYSGPLAFAARRMVAWRLDDGRAQDILDAPDDARIGGGQTRHDRVWSPTGESVVLAGTHLPLVDSQVSTASHVIEYWPDSGRWVIVARLAGRMNEATAIGDRIEVDDDGKTRQFERLERGGWREVDPVAAVAKTDWALNVEESLNQPADVVAKGPAGQTVPLTNLNPQFDANSWGVASTFKWQDDQGRPWEGGLLVPSDAVAGKRLPLVIQAYTYDAGNFYLDGPNPAGLGFTSAYPGRALMREGVLVLGMKFRPANAPAIIKSGENLVFNQGVKSAVQALVKQGLVDPARVGIIGFSATGAKVMNLITFSELPVRAATIADGDADTLFSYAITYSSTDATWGYKESVNGGLPVRPDLATWIARDPALNTDCVKTALRFESYGAPVTNYWDVYALMRRQYKPAELILIPDGAHMLSTPSHRMISLQGNVDWFKFWLRGEKRFEPLLATETKASLRTRYEAWDQMAVMKEVDDRRPKCSKSIDG